MSGVLLWLTTYVLNAAWLVPLMVGAGWGLSRLSRLNGPAFQHKIWVSVLMLATIAPAAPVFKRVFAHEAWASSGIVDSDPRSTPADAFDVTPGASGLVLPAAAIHAVSGLCILSVCFFAFRLYRLFRRTLALVRKAAPAQMPPDYMAMWSRSMERIPVKEIRLLHSNDVSCPVTASFRLPVLLFPSTFFEHHSPREFLAAIGHECAHIQRNDFSKNAFYEVLSLLTAFHPVTWLVKYQIAQTREMVCDRLAADQLMDRRAYGRILLQIAAKIPSTAPATISHTVGMFHTNSLERRVMTVMTAPPSLSTFRRSIFGVSATLALALCAGASGWLTQPVEAQSPVTASQPNPPGEHRQAGKDLSCTYYEKGAGTPGTCSADARDRTRYLCHSVKEPSKSQVQMGCESKVRRAAELKP